MPSEELSTYTKEIKEFFGRLNSEDFEKAHCIFCKTSSHSYVLFKSQTIEVSRCPCGFVYNSRQPKLTVLNEFYQKSKAMTLWAKIKTSAFEDRRQQVKFNQASLYLGNTTVKSVLDVGCGTGVFLRSLKEINPSLEVFGVDQNEEAVAACNAKDIMATTQDAASFLASNKRSWDAISMWGTLEHLKDPIGQLRQFAKKISLNGYLVICVPNVASRVVRTLWEKCFTFCPQHLWYFDQYTLERLMDDLGFAVQRKYTIEPESLPVIKHTHGFGPYDVLPSWAETKYTPYPVVDYFNTQILGANEGYKLVFIARKR